ncbi:tRNA lysidine(34) synthetase TilS [Jatrophihabitans sp. DSM 45814]
MGPDPAVAAVRLAVRQALSRHPLDVAVIVACSGGADSLALAAAAAFECAKTGRSAGLITIDHGLQAESAVRAAGVAAIGYELGFDPVAAVAVTVGIDGGPEAAARTARYEALERARTASQPPALVLLGHTADDQAETVLLGLGRGSGPRSIAGMRPDDRGYLRPLLGLRRAETAAACRALGLPVWDDPHNHETRFRRVRLRHEVLPLLEDVLAGGVVEALARTASQWQQDLDALDELAAAALAAATIDSDADAQVLSVTALSGRHLAIQSRALKRWAEQAGAQPLTAPHVRELCKLISDWRGQGPIDLPGGYRVKRSSGTLELFR